MRKLTAKSSLDTLRKQAKRWLGEIRAGDVDACARFVRVHPRASQEVSLRDVQQALAREYGLPSWNDLRIALADLAADARGLDEQLAEFLEFACLRYGIRPGKAEWDRFYNDHPSHPRHAARLLSRNPHIAKASIHAAVLSGDLAEVERRLAQHPACANEKCPYGWEPLLYLCFGRLPIAAAGDHALAIARALLAAGANPHVAFGGSTPFTLLTGVIGEGEGTKFGQPPHPRARELAALLIEHGVDPCDPQALYNTSLEDDDVSWLDFLYDRSFASKRADARLQSSSRWAQDGLPHYLLSNAVGRNHLQRARWLLARGANARTPNHYSKRPLLRDALLSGFVEMAALLIQHGAEREELEGHDAFQAACMRMDRTTVAALAQQHPEYLQHADGLLKAAAHGRVDVVALLLDLGMSPDVANQSGTRALHAAASSNAVDVATLLLERGATVDPCDATYGSTPLGWARYFERVAIRDLLANISRDVLALVAMGNVERLREVLSNSAPRPVMHEAVLFSLPEDDDVAAEIAALLVQHGANPRIIGNDGVTAIEYNARRGLDHTADLLREVHIGNSSSHNQ